MVGEERVSETGEGQQAGGSRQRAGKRGRRSEVRGQQKELRISDCGFETDEVLESLSVFPNT